MVTANILNITTSVVVISWKKVYDQQKEQNLRCKLLQYQWEIFARHVPSTLRIRPRRSGVGNRGLAGGPWNHCGEHDVTW